MKKQSLFSALLKSAGYILLFLASQVLASLLVELAVIARAGAMGADLSKIAEKIPAVLASLTYETMFLSSVILTAILHLVHKKRAFLPFQAKKTPANVLFGSVFLGLGAFFLAGILISISSLIPAVQASQDAYSEQQNMLISSGRSLAAEILFTCIGAPVMEEWIFRGMVQGTLKKSMRPSFAIALSSILFALIHGNLYQLVFTLPFGVLLGFMAHRFGSILPSILLHAAFNFANYPMRIGLYLGYGEENAITLFCYLAAELFYLLALPLGIILIRHELEKMESKSKKNNRNGEQIMASPEFLLVGLGNPEAKYARNRHNCGFLAIDHIAEELGTKIQTLRFSSLSGEAIIGGKKVILLKPQTYMNLSGKAVREAADFYKIPPQNILVLFDDISFPAGIFRIREKGSAGGHNGIKSIISSLGSEEFPRVKIGVGNPPEGWELMNWVLGNPSPEDEKRIRATFPDIAKTASLFVEGKLDLAAASFNGKMHE